MHTGRAIHQRRTSWLDRTPPVMIGSSSGMGTPRPARKRMRNRPTYPSCSMTETTRPHLWGQDSVSGRWPPVYTPIVLCGQKEPFHGGQTLRRWFIFLYL